MASEINKSAGKTVVFCVMLPLLFILYVMSSGPAQVLVRAGYLSEDVYLVLYAPVVYAFQNNRVCQIVLLWYDALWR